MKTLSYRTESVYLADGDRKWYLVDAEGETLGRLCSKVVLTGNKMNDKNYIWHTGYPGGQRFKTPRQVLVKEPTFLVENAVKGMLPRNRLGRAMIKKMHVYTGPTHPHSAQQPEKIDLLQNK